MAALMAATRSVMVAMVIAGLLAAILMRGLEAVSEVSVRLAPFLT
jgi:type II secretory pathway component PulJ